MTGRLLIRCSKWPIEILQGFRSSEIPRILQMHAHIIQIIMEIIDNWNAELVS